jgi:hypothetical protein
MKVLEPNFIQCFVVRVTVGTGVYFLRKLNIPPSIQKVPGSNSFRIPVALILFVTVSIHLYVFLCSSLNWAPTKFIHVRLAIPSWGKAREARPCTQLTGIDIPNLDKLCNKRPFSKVNVSIPIGYVGLKDLSCILERPWLATILEIFLHSRHFYFFQSLCHIKLIQPHRRWRQHVASKRRNGIDIKRLSFK